MFFKKFKTPGLSHLSYIIGSKGSAAVIDPRRDCDIYLEIARCEGLEISHIFETHRNEDLISGTRVLAAMSGARVLHGPDAAATVAYAETARDGDRFEIGQLALSVLQTPGHTDDHIAIVVQDRSYPDGAVGVFTGDALFVGDVGRADFYPDRAAEVAGLLYDSLQKLLALGDQALIWPAHGAGSVCGAGMAEREFSSIGHERRNNPRLQCDKAAFVEFKTGEHHYQPPYFRLMERLNLEGGDPGARVARPRNLSFAEYLDAGARHNIDVREPGAFAAGHLEGCYCIPVEMLSSFAGWFIREGESVALVAASTAQLELAQTHLARIGLDHIIGGYVGVVPAAAKGAEVESIEMVCTETVKQRVISKPAAWTLLDVRDANEVAVSRIEGSQHIYVGELNERWSELDTARHYTVMCASGMRATIAASWLTTKGFANIDVYLGSMGAWKASMVVEQ